MATGPETEEEDDASLLVAARAGAAPAFERLVARYADAVFRIAAAHLGRDEAEDAAQEAFIRVHQGLAGFQGESRLSTWIFRIATNVALTRARRRGRRPAPLPEAEPAARAPGPEEAAAAEERRAAV